MRPTVRIAFDLSLAGAGSFFTLDDPVKGILPRVNLMPNPSAEIEVGKWGGANVQSVITRSTAQAFSGVASFQGQRITSVGNLGINYPLQANILADGIPVEEGKTYTLSGYMRSTVARNIDCQIVYSDIAGNQGTNIDSTTVSATAGVWTRVSVSGLTPSGASFVRLNFRFLTAGIDEIGFLDAVLFEESATLGSYFDGSTGKWVGTPNDSVSLDTASSFTLAGEVFEDVSADVRSVSVRRGRSRELTAFTAGQASVVLDNRDRLYDPTAGTATSPYGPSILPRKAISIEAGGVALFTGIVEDWDLQFSLDGDAITTAKSTDGFTLLAGETITPGTATPEGSGARVDSILDDANWPIAKRRIDTGVASLGADVVADNVTALSYLQTIDVSEGGALFVAKDGSIEFLERTASQGATVMSFTDDGTGVPFSDISLEFGTESLFTQVSVEYVGGTAVATAGTAVTNNYGLIELNVKTLLADSDEADDIASFYLFRFSEPQVRIDQLEVRMNGLSAAQQLQVLDLELGDPVDIVFTPQGIGDAIERVVVVDQIEHNITPADHVVRLNFSQTLTGFTLDLDRLDEGRLGF